MTVELVAVAAALLLGMVLLLVAVAVAMVALQPGAPDLADDEGSFGRHPLLAPGR